MDASRVQQDVENRAPPERDPHSPARFAQLPSEDGRHLVAILVAERRRKQTKQCPVQTKSHHTLLVEKPLARASLRSSDSRCTSAVATFLPNAVIR